MDSGRGTRTQLDGLGQDSATSADGKQGSDLSSVGLVAVKVESGGSCKKDSEEKVQEYHQHLVTGKRP